MRITEGRWKGRKLMSPGGRVRPTAEEVRSRWIALLAPMFKGQPILDLFAGSGALGLEALSRGAATADFVETGSGALHALKGNVAALRARPVSRIFVRDALTFVDGLAPHTYAVALADPPYTSTLSTVLVERWKANPFARILSVEHPAAMTLPPGGRRWVEGDTAVTTYTAAGTGSG
jgi:16S rRNA (guanine966-N2)-methyltransferase